MLQGRLPSRYRVIEEVGQGGMAVVYKAHDETLKREVAVKVLHAHLLAERESKARLEREAQAVAKLQHDNIVQIFDYSGIESPASYIVTEFIDGQTLKQFMGGRPTPAPEVAALIAIDVGIALVHAHSFGIIHRDVKPENVMVRKDGILKLMDFGVAQIMDLERMTVTGQLLGSPAYMAPELLEGKPLDVRTDVFSVGIMLYQLSTGALPFSGRNPHEVLKRIAEGRFADPRTINRLVDDRLARIIARALARRPEDRYPTIAALGDDLRAFVADAGLGSSREELRAYFTAPDDYEKAVTARMLAALVVNGKRAREAKKAGRALELWNRALSMDPTNKEVLAELKRLETRQNLKRGSLAAAGALVLGAGALFILRTAGRHDEITPPPAVASKQAQPAPGGPVGPATAPKEVHPAPTPPRPRPVASAGGRRPLVAGRRPPNDDDPGEAHPPASAAPAERKQFTLAPVPQRAEVWVDDVQLPDHNPGHSTIELTWDRDHRLEFRNPCCAPEIRRMGPSHPVPQDNRLVIRFQGRPAMLTVRTVPAAEGLVALTEADPPEEGRKDVRASGRIGEGISVPFEGDSDMVKNLKLTVDVAGRATKIVPYTIRSGDNKAVDVDLER
jgi:tRNA A-37 threonylcarbamoyl transferase component Bud32